MVIKDVVGNDDDDEDEVPAPDRSGSSNVKGICMRLPNSESHPLHKESAD